MVVQRKGFLCERTSFCDAVASSSNKEAIYYLEEMKSTTGECKPSRRKGESKRKAVADFSFGGGIFRVKNFQMGFSIMYYV